MFGPLLVRVPPAMDWHKDLYDFDEFTLVVDDWVHELGDSMFLAHHHANGTNKALNLLINGMGRYTIMKENETLAVMPVPTFDVKPVSFDRERDYKIAKDRKQNPKHARCHPVFRVSPECVNFLKSMNSAFCDLCSQNSRYRFRVINAEFLNCPIEVSIDNHTLLVVSSDGRDIEPVQGTISYLQVEILVLFAISIFQRLYNCDRFN